MTSTLESTSIVDLTEAAGLGRRSAYIGGDNAAHLVPVDTGDIELLPYQQAALAQVLQHRVGYCQLGPSFGATTVLFAAAIAAMRAGEADKVLVVTSAAVRAHHSAQLTQLGVRTVLDIADWHPGTALLISDALLRNRNVRRDETTYAMVVWHGSGARTQEAIRSTANGARRMFFRRARDYAETVLIPAPGRPPWMR